MRPRSLREVVERTRDDPTGDWDHHLREFLDAFYGADGDTDVQAAFVCDEPGFTGNAEADAFLGGVGEHLSRRWGLPCIPSWVRNAARYLDTPMFVPGDRAFRSYLICVSPVSFRARLIFTGPDPLQRARFPYHRGVIAMPAVYPARDVWTCRNTQAAGHRSNPNRSS